MLLTGGLIVLGGIALLSMVMMIGNVLSKSPYGKTWAMLGGLSVLLAGGLVILQLFVPSVDALGTADEQEATKQEQESTNTQDVTTEETEEDADATAEEEIATEDVEQAEATSGNMLEDLSVISNIMDLLKQGKPLPAEYLALLGEDAPGVAAEQAKADPVSVSAPLQSQLVSLNRSQGTSYKPTNSYVPTTKPATTASGNSGKVVASNTKPSQAPANSGTTTKPTTGTTPAKTEPAKEPAVPAPNRPPVTSQTPAPAPEPPATSQPPVSTTAATLDGGLLKSVLGRSKSDVESYFKYNQFLGQEGNTLRYLRGATIVEVTFTGSDIASQLLLRFDRFTPQNKDMAYYEDYMRNVAGVTRVNASSRDSKNIYWNGVYPGVSALHFHIDTGANYGYVRATY